MAKQDYSIRVDLQKLNGAFLKNLTGKTATKRCIIIPIDDNPSMFLGEKGCYLNMSAFETQNNQYGDTYLLKPNLPKEVRESMTDEERNAVPILGNMAPMRPSEQQVNGSVDANAPEGQQQNDLPF